MEVIKVIVYNVVGNSFCVEADDGQLIFNLLEKAFKENRAIQLDFQNVEMITSAFLNTAVGQLYRDYDSRFIKEHLSVVNMLPEDMALLKRAVDTAKLFYSDPDRLQKSIDEVLGD